MGATAICPDSTSHKKWQKQKFDLTHQARRRATQGHRSPPRRDLPVWFTRRRPPALPLVWCRAPPPPPPSSARDMRHRRVWSFCTALALAPVPALHRGKENVTMTTILETLLTDVAPFAEAKRARFQARRRRFKSKSVSEKCDGSPVPKGYRVFNSSDTPHAEVGLRETCLEP